MQIHFRMQIHFGMQIHFRMEIKIFVDFLVKDQTIGSFELLKGNVLNKKKHRADALLMHI